MTLCPRPANGGGLLYNFTPFRQNLQEAAGRLQKNCKNVQNSPVILDKKPNIPYHET